MMDLAMNFDTDECLVTAMFDKGNRNDTMEACLLYTSLIVAISGRIVSSMN